MSDVLDELMGIYSTLVVDSKPDYDSSCYLNEFMESRQDNADPVLNVAGNESMEIIKSMINKQHTYIEFLQEEIREKNLLIKMLNFRNANDGNKININDIDECERFQSSKISISSENAGTDAKTLIDEHFKIVDYDETSSLRSTYSLPNDNDIDTTATSISTSLNVSLPEENFGDISSSTSPVGSNAAQISPEQFSWERHSSGFAGRIMDKMGFKKGKGLGKNENGITEPIKVNTSTNATMVPNAKKITGQKRVEENAEERRKKLFIMSSSMLNQMDEQRLSNNKIDVKVRCHGGCTIRCLYSHLPDMFKHKPDYILLHIGSNDCCDKTSDEVLNEFKKLTAFISKELPCSKIIISLPIVRADNSRSTAIQKIFKTKLQRLLHPCLDNSNIGLSHLGKKGLHLNTVGTRMMARNLISLIKQL